jgi:hypothetical protein
MNAELLRTKTITLMAGFLKDVLYENEELTTDQATDSATLYYDLVQASEKQVNEEEDQRLAAAVTRDKEAAELKEQGIIDASDSFAVDMAGGPRSINQNTIYRG